MIRFHVVTDGETITTAWRDETDRLAVVEAVQALRREHGQEAAISTERDHTVDIPKPKRFRYNIFVKEGVLMVKDDDGVQPREIHGVKVQSRAYLESERDEVLAELRQKFPKATFMEVEV